MTRSRTAITLALAGLSAALPQAASARAIGSESASGDYAVAVATGDADNPNSLWVRVKTSPSQRATGNYTVVCIKGYGAGSKSDRVSGRGTFRRKVKLPSRNPDSCTLSAAVQLADGGRIRVTLLAF